MHAHEDPRLDQADQRTDLAWMNVKVNSALAKILRQTLFHLSITGNGAISVSYNRGFRQSIS